jgi:hypothetical protein
MFAPHQQPSTSETVKVGNFELTQRTWTRTGEVTYNASGNTKLGEKEIEKALKNKGFVVSETGNGSINASKDGTLLEITLVSKGFVVVQQLEPAVYTESTAKKVVETIVMDALYTMDSSIRAALERQSN